MLSFQQFREEQGKTSVTITVEGGGKLWMAQITELDNRPADDRYLAGMGLTTSATGRSGWEALANLARHMKNAGFLD
jgi:hypothetical protein